MKKTAIIHSAILFDFLALSGCSYVIEVLLKDDSTLKPTFQLTQKIPHFFDRAPEVLEISVYQKEGDKWDYLNPLWQINSDGIEIDEIIYSEIPKRFLEKAAGQDLAPETLYRIDVRGWGSSGWLDFKLRQR